MSLYYYLFQILVYLKYVVYFSFAVLSFDYHGIFKKEIASKIIYFISFSTNVLLVAVKGLKRPLAVYCLEL